MLQTETKESRRKQCEAYISKHIINKEVEWLIECGKIRESVYFKGACGDRYTIYTATKRRQGIIDFHTCYNSEAGVDVPEGFIVKDAPVTITHEEHKPIELPPGKYIVKIVREFDHIAGRSRYVAD